MMIDGRVPRLAGLVREALAVLAAILVAFALDAWWDGRVERSSMLEALDAVSIEVDRNLALADGTLAFNDEQGELVREAVGLDAEQIAALSEEDLARYARLPSFQLVTFELGAVTAFIEGGFLATLEDRELRADLAGLPRLQIELDEEADVVMSVSEQVNMAGLQATPIEDLVRSPGLTSSATTRAMLDHFTTDEQALRMLMARTFFLTDLYAEELRDTRARLAQVSDRIAAYLGDS